MQPACRGRVRARWCRRRARRPRRRRVARFQSSAASPSPCAVAESERGKQRAFGFSVAVWFAGLDCGEQARQRHARPCCLKVGEHGCVRHAVRSNTSSRRRTSSNHAVTRFANAEPPCLSGCASISSAGRFLASSSRIGSGSWRCVGASVAFFVASQHWKQRRFHSSSGSRWNGRPQSMQRVALEIGPVARRFGVTRNQWRARRSARAEWRASTHGARRRRSAGRGSARMPGPWVLRSAAGHRRPLRRCTSGCSPRIAVHARSACARSAAEAVPLGAGHAGAGCAALRAVRFP